MECSRDGGGRGAGAGGHAGAGAGGRGRHRLRQQPLGHGAIIFCRLRQAERLRRGAVGWGGGVFGHARL